MASPKSLTDFEIESLHYDLNLADGHAYHNLPIQYTDILDNLEGLWKECETTRVPDIECRFRDAYAGLAISNTMSSLPFFKICPTASNSIDIIGAVLSEKGVRTRLLEPVFDNLHLLLHRRRVAVEPLDEEGLFMSITNDCTSAFLDLHPCGALFLVQPNNPTGRCLDEKSLKVIADYCFSKNVVLIIDNSFRFFNRHPFDDYLVLTESGCSFMALEDTGKVWPTHDLKASLLFCSRDFEQIITSIYNELFLSTSRFTLALLEKCLVRTSEFGLAQTIWPQVDERRSILRNALSTSTLIVDAVGVDSQISVEWIDCHRANLCDLDLTSFLLANGVSVLPGRNFFWASGSLNKRHFNVRLSLLKPLDNFRRAVEIIQSVTSAK